jgi:transposase
MRRSTSQGAISIDRRRLTVPPGASHEGQDGTRKPGAVAPWQSLESAAPLPLTENVLAELHWIASEGTPSLSRHARIVLARNEGRSLSEIAKILDVDRATVRRWLLRFERDGLRGLVHASTGKTRKRRFTDTVRDAVARLAMRSPAEAGEAFNRWSLRRLRAHVMRRGIAPEISVEGLRQLLRGLPLPDAYWRRGEEPVSPLGDEVSRGLEALAESAHGEVARRARIVLTRSRGLSEAEVAAALAVGRSCVRRWLQRFERHGILGLQTARRRSRPLVFTSDVRAAIVRHARMEPKQLGFPGTRWSLRALRTALMRQRVVHKISIQHLRRILAEAGATLRGPAEHTASDMRTPAHG